MKEVNKENEFERRLKEKADRFEMKPAPEVWQQVQHAVRKDRRRRFGWGLMAAALLFGVLGSGAFFMLEKKSLPPAAPPTAENNSNAGNTKKSPSSGSVTVNPSTPQNQNSDNALKKGHEEEISGNRKENENHSVPVNGKIESSEDALAVIAPATGQQNGGTTSSVKIDSVNSQPGEIIRSLSSKELALSLPEETNPAFPIQNTSLDLSSFTSSKHAFYLEVDAMPLNSFVRNHASSSPKGYTPAFVLSSYNSSYSFMKGYSAGANFFFQKNNKWLFGIGAHLSKTHLEAITSQETDLQYDSIGTAYDTSVFGGIVPVYDTVEVTTTQSQHAINQWLDISLMAGVKLFPDSKNHLRILAGIGYSRLLSSEISMIQAPASLDVSNTAAIQINTAGNPLPPYQKNQLQLFSEVAYERDLTAQLSFTAGMQFHYYPMNLLDSEELSQHMMWVGLKGGLLLRF